MGKATLNANIYEKGIPTSNGIEKNNFPSDYLLIHHLKISSSGMYVINNVNSKMLSIILLVE